MNFIDRTIGFFSPEAGLRRVTARAKISTVMNYDAASRGRRTYGWKAPATAADAAAFGSRGRMRQLSRDMVRNRPYAARGKDVIVANVVGEGIMPSIRSDSENAKTTVQELLERHLLTNRIDAYEEYDVLEMQQICMAAVFTDGEVLLRRRWRNGSYGRHLALPYQVELLEVDCLDTTIQSHGDNLVVEGIEYGPTGAIEAYHLYNEHPGAVMHRRALQSSRVPWDDIIHIRRFDRPGQLRGVPWLAPVMMTIGELSDYQEAQILKQKMSSLLAIMIKWTAGSNRPAKSGAGLEELAPGAIVDLPEGAEPVPVNPPIIDGYDEFMGRGLRTIAAGLGITYEALTADLRGVNFSSGRMGRNEMDRLVRMWQRGLMIMQFGAGMERWFREGLDLVGHRGIDFRMDWTPPRRILVDPTKEIPAMVEEVEAGIASRQGVQRELGRDPDRIREERRQDKEADAAAGLSQPAPSAAQAKKATGANSDEGEKDEDGQ
ncbi:phage portal protein [Haematobacter massiliensis]|uniref:phage portal protein n=1 Tax=Haematobacter massiliensis TaxID=195105 RepID=UPI000B498B9F|nr:phage portal protein [Haematobacter massiliensis]OWJ69828.1 phage portal protein [Haematobacter massiliensis]